ncbi:MULTISPECIES: sigma-70 family RNA polymerase sigma factor [Methylorubrum]|jgi:RNA polymerase sigma-70 factor (ECF subfamily)|uniref:sigma-70 family RNA polymerase sigma factor n=1 Tax=Methylorubrum TaxID=2282523 RepID=UPI00209ED23B|nr:MULTISPECIES: sigma-70 family RNA polymerase sigma factor [Methylorubrum]MCP1547327.1 RNA polymerase sigma-70 factor (ECF subfamily) [Methylorubrum zatmanii]MCP1556057.1 RNA polymerase sigma-70 factor (ECF subfamily) [Methylorubrum extorquens]MCP1577630.1 RNA polymerase sigma-70 factor (ECF subfamily) [Methylorubrum extorquens]
MASVAVGRDSKLIETLFREHSSWLGSWLSRQPWTVHAPEDIVSDVFLSLLTLPNVASVREPRAMMTTIAKRIIFDARRRKKLQNAYEDALMAIPEAVDVSPEDRLIIIQALQKIDLVLAKLSPRARSAFLMSQIDGMANKDIARELNVSLSAVSKYMTQGFSAVYLAKMES